MTGATQGRGRADSPGDAAATGRVPRSRRADARGDAGATPIEPFGDAADVDLPLRERQRNRTRADLVSATLDVIERAGLEQATIERITRRAGTSRATLYAHFPGGRTDVITGAYQQLGDRLIAVADADAAQHDDWIEQACAYQRAMLRLAQHRELSVFYNIDGPQHFGLLKRRGSGSQRTLDALARILGEAQRAGEIATDLDVAGVAALLVGAIRETGIDTTRDPASAAQHTRAFQQLLGALAAR